MSHWDARANAADAGWDRAGLLRLCLPIHPQHTVDRILQLRQTSVYQGGANILGDKRFLLEKNIVLVVQSGFGFP